MSSAADIIVQISSTASNITSCKLPGDSTVKQLKIAYQDQTGVPPDQQHLIFPFPSEMEALISEYRTVKHYSGKSLEELKHALGEREGERAYQQINECPAKLNKLASEAKKHALKNDERLIDCKVIDNSLMLCILSLRGDSTLFLTTLTHEITSISDVDPSTTIRDLKQKAHLAKPAWPEHLRLVYDGKVLDDDAKSLRELSIPLTATIVVVFSQASENHEENERCLLQ